MRGRLQKKGEVIHIICDHITDHDAMIRLTGRMDFPLAPCRDDGAAHGSGPDPRHPTLPRGRSFASAPFGAVQEQQDILRMRIHDLQ